MKTLATRVKDLIVRICEKAERKPVYSEFEDLSDQINHQVKGARMSRKYLYDAYSEAERQVKNGVNEVSCHLKYLDDLALYLGYRNFDHFSKLPNAPFDPRIKEVLGNWYSYVRSNSGKDQVLISIYLTGRY
ncbi:MAG: hypothetical protein HC880_16590 [Bacteroidia bacterium]|nr:hypothetical protein [Bacteroidia bacterium]